MQILIHSELTTYIMYAIDDIYTVQQQFMDHSNQEMNLTDL